MFLFLYTMTLTSIKDQSDRLKILKNAVKNSGIKSVASQQNISKVYINDIYYEIFVYDLNFDIFPSYNDSTLNKLYICINCEFAKWVRDQLFKLIEDLPLIYQKKFLEQHSNTFIEHVEKSIGILNTMIHFIQKFINILLNFININVHDSSFDTDVLRTLLSLHFKISLIYDENSDLKKFDNAIIRILLGSLNSVENFILLNCKLNYFYSKNRHFFGYPMNTDPEVKNIDNFLDDISPLKLEAQKSCSVKQMLMLDIIPRQFMAIKWETKHGRISVEHVMRKIKESTDNELIFWYQTFMFDTIMKVIFTKTQNHCIKHSKISDTVVDIFKTIYKGVFLDVTNIPTSIIECLSLILPKNDQEKKSYVKKFLSNFISFKTYDPRMLEKIMTCIHLFQNIILETYSNTIQIAAENVDSVNDISLEELVLHLNKNIDDFVCFIRIFDFFLGENNKMYNASILMKSETVQLFERDLFIYEKSLNTEEDPKYLAAEDQIAKNELLNHKRCSYFGFLYQICVDTIIILNMAISENQDEELKNFYYLQALLNLREVNSSLLKLIKIDSWNFHYFKMVYSVIPYIELLEEYHFPQDFKDIRRTVLIIMTEFNSYSIEFCYPPEFNFLLFNNIDFDKIGLNHVLNNPDESINCATTHKVHHTEHEDDIGDNKVFKNSNESINETTTKVNLKEKKFNDVGDVDDGVDDDVDSVDDENESDDDISVHDNAEDRTEAFTSETNENDETNSSFHYSRIRSLFEKFHNKFGVFEQYEQIIKLNWKGGKHSIGDISKSLQFALLSPFNLYALYDVYLKVSFAILFYETYAVKDIKIKGKNNDTMLWKLYPEVFPKSFEEIANFFNEFTNYYYSKSYDRGPINIDAVETKIFKQLEKFGISMDLTQSNQSLRPDESLKKAYSHSKEMLFFINYVLDCYYFFTK